MGAYSKAIILAGGGGTRLRCLGEILPKCLAQVYDQPLLIKQIEQCMRAGAREIFVSIAARFLPILEAVLSFYTPDRETVVRCIPESKPLGAVRGLASLAPLVSNAPCLVMLGDEYFEDNETFDRLGNKMHPEDLILGVIREENRARMDCNVVVDVKGNVLAIKDKPLPDEIQGDLRWCGLLAFRPGILQFAQELVNSHDLSRGHLGDLLDALRQSEITTGMIEFQKENINLNNTNDILLASLLEARGNWQRTNPDKFPKLNRAIQKLLATW